MEALVARIGKAHGLRGEVTVQVHTDVPDERFEPGTVFVTEPADAGPLTLHRARLHNGIWLLTFDEAADRTAAEGLRGTRLLLDVADDADDAEDGWYESDLVGLAALAPDGTRLGTVAELRNRPAQDLLVLDLERGTRALVPFVEAIVPTVDVEAGHVVVDAPPGLLELDAGR